MRIFILLSFAASAVRSCTDILVTPGASADGSSMIAYNADSPTLFGVLYHYPASKNNGTLLRKVYDWDSGVFLGEIEEVEETFNVVGNSNEHGLVIAESTFGGTAPLAWNQTGAIIDYGSLIYITLQRSKTVREAIRTMVDLMDTYGYASGGESFSLADRSGEVWMMEVIGRGSELSKGAVWVAQRIPDGAIAAHANQARITTFPRDDPENCLYAKDVVDVAIHYGLYQPDPNDPDHLQFSFSDVYHPVSFVSARQGEARVWSIFSQIVGQSFASEYESYAVGQNVSHRMPLYVTPPDNKKVSVTDIMHYMTSHYERTSMDSSRDVGSGLFGAPYRPRPLVWEYKNSSYHNERSVATPKTGWNFVAQVRPWMPRELAALVWFAVDDSSTSPRTPFYGSNTAVSKHYAGHCSQDGVKTPLLTFDLERAFWVQNMVSNFCYSRWNEIYPVVRAKIDGIQKDLLSKVAIVDQRALELYDGGKEAEKTVRYLTLFSVQAGNRLHKTWFEFYGQLFVRFRDFYTITALKDEPVCGCHAKEPGLSQSTKERIVRETGDHYEVPSQGRHSALRQQLAVA